ncbi:phosphoribosylglycinamide formyltransferase [Synergistales bacterium]|nr:phosphoribosylglycinamide formyltransferase [Synergistales bacterium]
MLKLGVMVSGRGSNLGAIMKNISEGKLDAIVEVVISNKRDAQALRRVEEWNARADDDKKIETFTVERSSFADKDSFEENIASIMEEKRVDLIVLAGYMSVLGSKFTARFGARIINIHPSLLPSFPGLHAQKQALTYGVKISGCTVHFVDETLDGGAIISQVAVPVLDGDTESVLSERILKEEHRLLPETIQKLATNQIRFG